MATNLPYEIVDLDPHLNKKLSDMFSDELENFVQVGPQKMLVPVAFRQHAKSYYNFQLRPDDIFVVGFPRSGTTLTQDLIWLLTNNLDYNAARSSKSVLERVPLLESASMLFEKALAIGNKSQKANELLSFYITPVETLNRKTGGRLLKTHLYFNLLPPDLFTAGCKIIYVARNPKDVMVSFFHLHRNILGRKFRGDFKDFFDLFISDTVFFGPYWAHLEQAWNRRHLTNFRFVLYEDITTDLERFIVSTADFLGKKLSTEDVERLRIFFRFDEYKKFILQTEVLINSGKDPNENFVRNGKIGDYKNYFTPEMNEKADNWIRANLQRTGINLQF